MKAVEHFKMLKQTSLWGIRIVKLFELWESAQLSVSNNIFKFEIFRIYDFSREICQYFGSYSNKTTKLLAIIRITGQLFGKVLKLYSLCAYVYAYILCVYA